MQVPQLAGKSAQSHYITPDAVLAALESVLNSEDFVAAPRLTSLLEFIVKETLEGRSDKLKGFNIANKVFGRDETFDARTDPLVRVQANRLRKALERYYLLGGKAEAIRISVPKGAYVAVFETQSPDTSEVAAYAPLSQAQPTVAVLPFVSIGNQDDRDYLADGLTEELTISLAQIENFLVIARQSTTRYKGVDVDLRAVGRELQVRFVMQGSVQLRCDTLRVTAQLTDTLNGVQVWAKRFDRKFSADDIFSVQDEISNDVISHIADAYGVIPRLLEKETRGKRVRDMDAYDAVLRFYHYQTFPNLENFKRARKGLRAAVDKNPDYTLAAAALSELYSDNFGLHFDPPYDQLDDAYELARSAVVEDSECQQAHFAMAFAHFHRRERRACINAAQRVLDLNPNAPYYSGAAGWLIAVVGEWEQGLEILTDAYKRNPFHPSWFNVAPYQYHFGRGEYEQAMEAAEQVRMPDLPWGGIVCGSALQRLGRHNEARAVVDDLRDRFPDFAVNARDYIRKYVFDDALCDGIYGALVEAGLSPHPE